MKCTVTYRVSGGPKQTGEVDLKVPTSFGPTGMLGIAEAAAIAVVQKYGEGAQLVEADFNLGIHVPRS